MKWQAGRFEWDLSQSGPLVMGIVNVTPDSFSDGGVHAQAAQAISHAELLLEQGAHILDLGGESTRPRAERVSAVQEWARLEPVLKELMTWKVPLSVDTMKAVTMERAVDLGVDILNDVYAFQDEGAAQVLAASTAGGVVMHMKGQPQVMQQAPIYDDVVQEVHTFLVNRLACLQAVGVEGSRLLVDPGFGFGKTVAHNVALMRATSLFAQLGAGVLIGVSRKRMIGDLTGQTAPLARVSGSVAAALYAIQQGAAVVRVHDVRATVDALKVWAAMVGA